MRDVIRDLTLYFLGVVLTLILLAFGVIPAHAQEVSTLPGGVKVKDHGTETLTIPRPLTAEQRAEALVAALNTSNARISIQQLDLEYRNLRDQAEAKLRKAEAEEMAIVGKFKKAAGAEACSLTTRAEWSCEKAKEKPAN